METKKCTMCLEQKGLDQFHKRSKSRDGLCFKCKDCDRRVGIERYAMLISSDPLYNSKRWFANRDSNRAKARLKYVKNKEKNDAYSKEYYEKNKHKTHARSLVRTALYRGDLVRKSICEVCKIKPAREGHHPDYTKPLEVMWLCNSCHKRIHVKKSKYTQPK